MKLYSLVPQDCSGRVRWLLNELNVPYEEMRLSYKGGDLQKPEYLAVHPLGQVPALDDDGLVLFESYAIVQYLADKYAQKNLAPAVTDLKSRAIYTQWMMFTANSADEFFSRFYRLPKMDADYNAQWGEHTRDKVQKVLATIEKQLQGQDYILGSFSAVDICLAYSLDTISEESFLNDYPRTKAYLQKLMERPACVKSEIFKRQ